jgi:hypothetical protein
LPALSAGDGLWTIWRCYREAENSAATPGPAQELEGDALADHLAPLFLDAIKHEQAVRSRAPRGSAACIGN